MPRARDYERSERRSPEEQTVALPATPLARVLSLQQGHGNAAVTRMLMRAPAAETPIRAGAGTGFVFSDSAALYPTAEATGTPLAQLPKDTKLTLTSEAGTFYGVVAGDKRGFVSRSDLATSVEQFPEAEAAEFEKKAAAASAAIDAAGHTMGGKPPSVAGTAKVGSGIGFPKWFMDLQYKVSMMDQWGAEEEAAQQVLDDYATAYVKYWHNGKVPASLQSVFQYVGRSSKNDAAAAAAGLQATRHFGGAKGSPNWCTATSTTSVLDGLKLMGYKPTVGPQDWANNAARTKSASGDRNFIGAPAAYSAQLLPGDQVMYLFDGAQYGGHTVTVVDDLGESFTHVSGNTGAAVGVGIGESQRLKGKPTPDFDLSKCNKVDTKEDRDASTAYIRSISWGGKVLVYSILRYGTMFEELETLKALHPVNDAAAVKAILDKYKLAVIPVTT